MRVSQTYVTFFAAFMLCAAFAASATAQSSCPPEEYLVCDSYSGNIGHNGNTFEFGIVSSDPDFGTTQGDGPLSGVTGLWQSEFGPLTYNSFFVYDIASDLDLSEVTAISVTFFAPEFYTTNSEPLILDLYDMTDPGSIATVQNLSASTTDLANAFADMETGALYGSYVVPTDGKSGLEKNQELLTFEVNLSSQALIDLAAAEGGQFAIGAHVRGSESGIRLVDLSLTTPSTGISAVPEVSATGALTAFGSLLAMMAFLSERRRATRYLLTF